MQASVSRVRCAGAAACAVLCCVLAHALCTARALFPAHVRSHHRCCVVKRPNHPHTQPRDCRSVHSTFNCMHHSSTTSKSLAAFKIALRDTGRASRLLG